MLNKKILIKKGQAGLLAPTPYNGVIGDITTKDGLLTHTANLSNFVDSSGIQNLISQSNSKLGNSLGKMSISNLFTKNLGNSGVNVGGIANSALGVVDNLTPKAEDTASKVTSGVFNGLSSVASLIPGVGSIASVALKGLGTLFGAGVKNVKGNSADELVDSSSSYTGADALDSKRFGILGLGKAKDYKQDVSKRQAERDTAHSILQSGKDDLLASNNVQQLQLKDDLNKNASNWMYNIRAGKMGTKIQEAKRLSKLARERVPRSSELIKARTAELQIGGSIKNRSIDELIEYAKKVNPRFIQRLSEPPRGIDFIDDEGQPAKGSHYLESAGEYVIPRIQEINGELKFLSHKDAINRALEVGNYLKMTPEEAIDFAKNYKKGWPKFFQKFQNGGQMNVIPEGALHARKNNLTDINPELEGITSKGIPVITQEDGGIVQHAEVERSEIIFTKEVTDKLEELRKLGTDEAAIEAGKLLASQIMENTIDNTGELLHEN